MRRKSKMIIQALKDNFLWRSQFDEFWRLHIESNDFVLNVFSREELDKQKYFWREKRGRERSYGPRLAAYHAFKEVADRWYLVQDESNPSKEALQIAYVLQWLCPYLDKKGNYENPKDVLDQPWRDLAELYYQNRQNEKEEKIVFADKLSVIRFRLAEIDEAWEKLKSGIIPPQAMRIWAVSYPRKSARQIISDADVTITEFAFWMRVFKHKLNYHENVVFDEHMYYRPAEPEDLLHAIKSP